jgi:hypothetical protein
MATIALHLQMLAIQTRAYDLFQFCFGHAYLRPAASHPK